MLRAAGRGPAADGFLPCLYEDLAITSVGRGAIGFELPAASCAAATACASSLPWRRSWFSAACESLTRTVAVLDEVISERACPN
jgi:hypothetical protein